MRCPDCSEYMHVVTRLVTVDDDRPVYTSYQWWRCPGCGARFFAELVEDKTNVFNDDLVSTGWRPKPEAWEATRKEAARCRRPEDTDCTCKVHQHPPRCHGEYSWYAP